MLLLRFPKTTVDHLGYLTQLDQPFKKLDHCPSSKKLRHWSKPLSSKLKRVPLVA
jgi:hypothetical protein